MVNGKGPRKIVCVSVCVCVFAKVQQRWNKNKTDGFKMNFEPNVNELEHMPNDDNNTTMKMALSLSLLRQNRQRPGIKRERKRKISRDGDIERKRKEEWWRMKMGRVKDMEIDREWKMNGT